MERQKMSTTAWTMHEAVAIRSITGGRGTGTKRPSHADEQNIREAILEVGSAPNPGVVDHAVRIIADGNAESSDAESIKALEQAGVVVFYVNDDDIDTD